MCRETKVNGRKLNTKEICLFPILGVIMFVLKFAMMNLPNIEPVSLLVIIYTLSFGYKAFWPISVYVICEFLTFGVNIYSISYLYIWFILMIVARIQRKMESPLSWAIVSAAFGLLFGLFCTPVYFITSGSKTALTWWVAGFPYDALHGVGNFAMALILFKPLKKLFEKFSI